MRLIDADVLLEQMQWHDNKVPFENEATLVAKAIGLAYIKLVENQPTVEAPDINVGNIDTTTHDSIPAKTGENDDDKTSGGCISRTQAIEPEAISRWKKEFREYVDSLDIARDDWKGIIEYIDELPSVQPDAVTASLEELINDYGEDGYFIIDGVNYQANELLNELKINSSVGEKFRIQITKTIVAYVMKFGD